MISFDSCKFYFHFIFYLQISILFFTFENMKAVFNKGQQKRKDRYSAISKTYNDLISIGSHKTAAVDETKRIHAPISIATIYRALKEDK